MTPDELPSWRTSAPDGSVAVLCGSFDLMNPGNLQSVREAGRQADHVVALVAPDTSDPDGQRPLLTSDERLAMVSYLRAVSVACFLEPDRAVDTAVALGPYTWIGNLEADTHESLARIFRPAATACVDTAPVQHCRTPAILAAIRSHATPITTPDEMVVVDPAPAPSKDKLVTVNGCFDILHPGHMAFLADARSMGTRLIVMINSDASVRRYKGPMRPIFPQTFRSAMLRELDAVDDVFVFDDDTPLGLLTALQPAVHVKGGTYEPDRVAGEQAELETWGGRLEYSPLVAQFSTTRYLEQIQETKAN